MRNKTRLILPVAALVLSAPTVLAQDPPPPPVKQEVQEEKNYLQVRKEALLKDIELTEEQKAQVDSIEQRYAPQLSDLATPQKPDSMTLEKIRPVLMKYDTEIRASLTAEQQQKFDENAEAWRRRGEVGTG